MTMEFYENRGLAVAGLRWTALAGSRSVFGDAAPTRGEGGGKESAN